MATTIAGVLTALSTFSLIVQAMQCMDVSIHYDTRPPTRYSHAHTHMHTHRHTHTHTNIHICMHTHTHTHACTHTRTRTHTHTCSQHGLVPPSVVTTVLKAQSMAPTATCLPSDGYMHWRYLLPTLLPLTQHLTRTGNKVAAVSNADDPSWEEVEADKMTTRHCLTLSL